MIHRHCHCLVTCHSSDVVRLSLACLILQGTVFVVVAATATHSTTCGGLVAVYDGGFSLG